MNSVVFWLTVLFVGGVLPFCICVLLPGAVFSLFEFHSHKMTDSAPADERLRVLSFCRLLEVLVLYNALLLLVLFTPVTTIALTFHSAFAFLQWKKWLLQNPVFVFGPLVALPMLEGLFTQKRITLAAYTILLIALMGALWAGFYSLVTPRLIA
jgi:hypothetical protein